MASKKNSPSPSKPAETKLEASPTNPAPTPTADEGAMPPVGDAGDQSPTQTPPSEPQVRTPPADEVPEDEVPTVPQREPNIDAVLPKLNLSVPPVGYVQRKPNPRLSPEEAHTQALLFVELQKQGVSIRDQGGVYPWLLRQIRNTVEE